MLYGLHDLSECTLCTWMFILLLSDEIVNKFKLNPSGLMCHLKPEFPYWFCLNDLSVDVSRVFSSVQLLSRVRLFATPWTTARQASLSITNSRSSSKLTSTESVMPCNHLILCHPLLLLPSIFPSIRVFKWVSFSHRVAKVLEFQLQHQYFNQCSMNTQDWSPLGWTRWISLQSKGLPRVFSNTTVQKHQFFGAQLSLQSNSHIHTWLLEKP